MAKPRKKAQQGNQGRRIGVLSMMDWITKLLNAEQNPLPQRASQPKPDPQPESASRPKHDSQTKTPTDYSARPGAPKGTYTPPQPKSAGTPTPSPKPTPSPTRAKTPPSPGSGRSNLTYAQRTLLEDMRRYANNGGILARFVPCTTGSPTYADMSYSQRAWYFYWRTQVRGGSYPETDRGYLLLHGYELISGIGSAGPIDAQEQLLRLSKAYGEHFPDVGQQLLEWAFGLSYVHGLGHEALAVRTDLVPNQDAAVNLLIADHAQDRPLKLPFCLVRAISSYDMTGSKFYKEGNEALMRQAIPRVLALVDAALVKKTGKGLLATYGPNRTRKQIFKPYPGAQCPAGNERQEISVPAYSVSQKLVDMVTELVRCGENILRAIRGSRGRLRGVNVEPEMAAMIEAFLKREYGEKPSAPEPKPEIRLDFDEIDILRQQSDEVREALRVSDTPEQVEKEKLTDLREVLAVVRSASAAGTALLEHLSGHNWQCLYDPVLDVAINQVNALAQRHLARAILVREGGNIIAEDDYLDELEHIYATGLHKAPPAEPPKAKKKTLILLEDDAEIPSPPPSPQPTPPKDDGARFDLSRLSDTMAAFMGSLTPQLVEVIYRILTEADPAEALRQLADDAMTMPELLFDEVNDAAMEYLDDILLEMDGSRPRVLGQYEGELRRAIVN